MNKRRLLISVLSFSLMATLISVESKNNNKEVSLNVAAVHDNAIGKLDLGRHNLLIGKDNAVEHSQTFVQYGKDISNKDMLRFVTAVKGDISKLSYTLNYDGLTTPLSKEVTTVYKGIQSGSNYLYYNGSSIVTTESDDYYFACVTVRFTSENKENLNLTAQLTINENTPVTARSVTLASIKTGSPSISLGTEVIEGQLQGDTITLPTYTASSSTGSNITNNVVVRDLTDANATFSENNTKLVSNVIGTHTIEYKVSDGSMDNVATKTITVEVYRKVFADGVYISGIREEKRSTNEQYVKLYDCGESVSLLNLPAGKVYYAEAEFEGIDYNIWNGFAHRPYTTSMEEIKYEEKSRWLDSAIRPLDKTSIFLDSKNWATDRDRYHNNINNTMGVPFSGDKIKYAVARINDYFYAFVNDNYVGTYTSDYYSNVDTIPSIFCNGYRDGGKFPGTLSEGGCNHSEHTNITSRGDGITVEHIDFYNDVTAVTNKVNNLTGGSVIRSYAPDTKYYSYDLENFNIGRNDTEGQFVEVYQNYDGQNANVWSPWTYFANDFTFEFDYTYNSTTEPADGSSQEGRMWVELRPWYYDPSLVEFGAKYSQSDPQFMMDQEGYKNAIKEENGKYHQPVFSSFGINKDSLKTIHYKISRRLTDAGSEIAMTISNPATNTVITTYTVNANDEMAKEELLILVQNKNVFGKFTNITWSTSVN